MSPRTRAAIKRILGPVLGSDRVREIVARRNGEALIAQRKLREKMATREAGQLKTVHIETRLRCNGRCVFCAAAVQSETRPDESMPAELFAKIAGDLRDMDYDQRISPYCNNEPLLDPRIYDFIRVAREICQKATLELKTNGMTLSEEKLRQLSETGLDILYVNDYHTSERITEKLRALCAKHPRLGATRVVYANRSYQETSGKVNRAGTNPSMAGLTRPMPVFCYRPFEMLTITVDGSVSTCSNDLMFRNTVGNVARESLADIWQGEAMNRLRADLLAHRREVGPACRSCDYQGLTLGHDYRSIYRPLLALGRR